MFLNQLLLLWRNLENFNLFEAAAVIAVNTNEKIPGLHNGSGFLP